MVTIQDVAKEAGLSVATVSRVLNDSSSVRPATKQRVTEAMEKLGYRPNLLGRNLRRRETNMILVFISTIVNSFYAKVIKGLEDVAEENGYHIMICTTYSDRAREQSYLDMLVNRLVDGAVFLTTSLSARELDRLNGQYAVVQCCEHVEGTAAPSVFIDNERAAYDMTKFLIESGRKELVHLTAAEPLLTLKRRREGFKRALEESGLPYHSDRILYGNFGFRNAKRISRDFLELKIPCDGAFAASDRMAAGFIRACEELGKRVPEDVAVAGFDNVDIAYMAAPTITTVSQSQYEMGAEAMRLLLKRLAGEEVEDSVVIPYEIIARESAPV